MLSGGGIGVRLNLRAPDIDVRPGDPLARHAKGFYKKAVEELRTFAADSLAKSAESRFAQLSLIHI